MRKSDTEEYLGKTPKEEFINYYKLHSRNATVEYFHITRTIFKRLKDYSYHQKAVLIYKKDGLNFRLVKGYKEYNLKWD